jgi:hypothetical protein
MGRFFLLVLLVVSAGCKRKASTPENAIPIARVESDYLYDTDIAGLVSSNTSKADSALFVRGYIESWIKNKLMMSLAADQIGNDEQVEDLVEEYRRSLILSRYEDLLTEKELPAKLSAERIKEYYTQHIAEYQLQAPLVKAYLIQLPKNSSNLPYIQDAWNKLLAGSGQPATLAELVAGKATVAYLDEHTWIDYNKLLEVLPSGTLTEQQLKSGFQLTTEKEEQLYFLQVNNVIAKNQPIPLELVSDDINKILRNKLKTELIDHLTEQTYKRALEGNKIEIFTK